MTKNNDSSGSKGPIGKFEQMYTNFRFAMYYAAYGILKDDGLAEDAVHNAFLRVYKKVDLLHFESDIHAKAFLIRTAQNAAKDIVKSKSQKHETIIYDELDNLLDSSDSSSLLEEIIVGEAVEAVQRALRDLNPMMADVLRFTLQYGYDDAYVAKLLDISTSNVRVLLHRGKKKLAAALQKEGVL